MILYLVVAAALMLMRAALRGQPGTRRRIYGVTLVALFLFSAFRFEVGCDWSGYWFQFEAQRYAGFEEAFTRLEPLWWAIIEVIQRLGLPYPWLNVVSSAIFFAGVHVLARRQPDPLGFLVLLFPILIINMPMSGIRQGAAIGLLCIAFSAMIDRKLLHFVAWTALASTLHSSAIVFLLLAPLVKGDFTWKRLMLAGVLALPGAAALLQTPAVEQATTRYLGTGIDAAGAAFRVGLLLLTGFAYFLLLRRPWRRTFPQDHALVSVGALIMAGMIVLVPISTVIGDRLGYYLIPIQTMIFARIPYLPLRSERALLAAAPYVGIGLTFVVWTALSYHFQICYIPYQTWLFGTPAPTMYLY